MTVETSPGRIDSLDGWRAIAISLVLLSHTAFSSGFPVSLRETWLHVFNGDLGVRIFFVLSAFLITTLLEREYEKTGTIDLRAFFVRRALRIWPLYFACLAVLGLLQFIGLTHESISNWLMALTFTRSFGREAVSPTAHFWSLAVEEQFYLIAPAALLMLRAFTNRGRAMGWLVAVVALALLTRLAVVVLLADGPLSGARSSFRYCDSLALGCLAALGRTRLQALLSRRSTTLVVLVGAGGVVLLEGLAWAAEGTLSFVPTLEAMLIAVMIVASTRAQPGIVARALNSPLAARLGLLSYSLYVWHALFLSAFMGPAFEALLPWDWRLWWAGTFLVASVSHVMIERPFLRLKSTLQWAHPRGASLSGAGAGPNAPRSH